DHDGAARPSRDRAGWGAGNRRTKMAEYVGLDVSMMETAVSIRRDGKRIWRGKCGSDPRLSNQTRGLMKTFGLVVPAGKGSRFEANVRALLADQEELAPILLPL